jgi:uncharacterized delta-60 repeat protein
MRIGGVLTTLAAALTCASPALAAPGDLDPSFGTGGLATLTGHAVSMTYTDVAALPGGGVLAVASDANDAPVVVRLTALGALDPSFDGDGVAVLDPTGAEIPTSISVRPDGRIVVAGFGAFGSDSEGVVWRLTPGGALDTSFDGDGMAILDSGAADFLHDVVALAGGTILAAGSTASGSDGALWRIRPDGTPDPDFGIDGLIGLNQGANEAALALAVRPDGKVVVAGQTLAAADADGVVWRLLPDGSFDPGFGASGAVRLDFDNDADDAALGLALSPDGRALAAGYSYDSTAAAFRPLLWRVTDAGELDSTFDVGGVAVLGDSTEHVAGDVVLQSNGKAVAVGYSTAGGTGAAWRVDGTGTLDASFGDQGVTLVSARLYDATLAADGDILAAGDEISTLDLNVVRLLGDPVSGGGGGGGGGGGQPVTTPTPTPSPVPGATSEPAPAATPAPEVTSATGAPGADGFGRRTGVRLGLAGAHSLRVRIVNRNLFPVTGSVRVRGGGRRSFSVQGDTYVTRRVSLSRALRKRLRHRHRLVLRLTATVTDPAGATRTVSARVTARSR